MPSEKTLRVQRRKAVQNKAVRTFSRSRVTAARAAIDDDPRAEDTAAAVKSAISALDKAATKGVIHANTAARRKSRLMRHLNKSAAAS